MSTKQVPSWEDQRRFWNWHWDHGAERHVVNPWKDRRHAIVLELLGSLRLVNPAILDIGCGSGRYTQSLAEFGRTTALDLSDHAIGDARSRFPRIDFRVGNVYDDPFPPGSFDVVVAQEVFDHVPDQPGFLERVERMLRPGGSFIVTCTNRIVMDRLRPGVFPTQPPEHVARYFSRAEVRRLVRGRFRILRSTTILPMGDRGALRIVNSEKLNRILGALVGRSRLEALKERAGLGYQIVVLAQKRP